MNIQSRSTHYSAMVDFGKTALPAALSTLMARVSSNFRSSINGAFWQHTEIMGKTDTTSFKGLL
jgi:hypothetical protein